MTNEAVQHYRDEEAVRCNELRLPSGGSLSFGVSLKSVRSVAWPRSSQLFYEDFCWLSEWLSLERSESTGVVRVPFITLELVKIGVETRKAMDVLLRSRVNSDEARHVIDTYQFPHLSKTVELGGTHRLLVEIEKHRKAKAMFISMAGLDPSGIMMIQKYIRAECNSHAIIEAYPPACHEESLKQLYPHETVWV